MARNRLTFSEAYDMAKREVEELRESISRIEGRAELTDEDQVELDYLYQWNDFFGCALSLFIASPWNFSRGEEEE